MSVLEHESTDRVKELKVVIPVELHLMLLRRKLLHGHTIASSVEEALRNYFAGLEDPHAEAPTMQHSK